MNIGNAAYPAKRSMNLYYKTDRTTKPATISLYVLFVLVCVLGLGKIWVYDLYTETEAARQTLAVAEDELNDILLELTDYNDVQERYRHYALSDEERELVDRMEVLALLDEAVGASAEMESISISSNAVSLQFSDVTLAQSARIVHALEASPIVESMRVNTAFTTETTSPDDDAPVRVNIQIHLQKEAAE